METYALSALAWWQAAGVDALVEDEPRDWLSGPARPVPAPSDAAPAVETLPATLDAVCAAAAAEAAQAIGGRALAPSGDPASGVMMLVDMPETGDADAGQLLSGAAGRLFDRMLAAIGRDRASVYLAPLVPAWTPVRPADAAIDRLTALARQHVALAAPRVLLVLGDAAAAALLGQAVASARGRLHALNLGEGSVSAIATFHPRFLLKHPARKAEAWQDLRLLLGELGW